MAGGVVSAPRPGWRLLAAVWAGILVSGGAGVAALAMLGPPTGQLVAPHPSPSAGAADAEAVAPPSSAPTAAPAVPPSAAQRPAAPGQPAPSPQPPAPVATPVVLAVAGPDSALLAPASTTTAGLLPQIGADGRMPRQVYAAPSVRIPAGAVRVALLISGFGLTERDSRAAIDQLPGPVSFAVSAYAIGAAPLLNAARLVGHELLASIPMEPQGYPQFDEGARSLRTGLNPEENRQNLEWALAGMPGAVGATGASDGLRGTRFAEIAAAFDPVLAEITRRGLLYVDARPGRPDTPGAPVRSVDVVLDEQLGRAEIDAKLSALERIARERGSALGLAGPLRPTTIERIAAWTKTLPGRGLVLVPVSALVNP